MRSLFPARWRRVRVSAASQCSCLLEKRNYSAVVACATVVLRNPNLSMEFSNSALPNGSQREVGGDAVLFALARPASFNEKRAGSLEESQPAFLVWKLGNAAFRFPLALPERLSPLKIAFLC